MSSLLDDLSPLRSCLLPPACGLSESLELDELDEGSLPPPPYPCIARRSPLFSGKREDAGLSLPPAPRGVLDLRTLEAICDGMRWLVACSFMDCNLRSTFLYFFASFFDLRASAFSRCSSSKAIRWSA